MSIEKLNPEQVKPQWAMNVDYISKINEIIDIVNSTSECILIYGKEHAEIRQRSYSLNSLNDRISKLESLANYTEVRRLSPAHSPILESVKFKVPEHVWDPVERAKLQHKKFENLQERYRRLEEAHKKLVKGHKKATLKIADLNRSNIGLIKKVKELNDDPLRAKLLQTQNDLIDLRNEYNDLKAKNTENKLGREMANRECDRLKVEIIALKTENDKLKDQIGKYVSEISELKKDLYLSHKQISCFLGESTLR